MIIGLMRIKDEARWIDRVVRSLMPVCDRMLILDDHSTDGTPEICEAAGAVVFRSEFEGCDEARDKDFLLAKAYKLVPEEFAGGNPQSPYWALMIDGDEELMAADRDEVARLTDGAGHCYGFRILYLWDDDQHIRVDGVYQKFCRLSMFRLMDRSDRFAKTTHGHNFHCSSVPSRLVRRGQRSEVRLLHYGYRDREDRIRKFNWYNEMDPGNELEDGYSHMVIGDLSPASNVRRHGGPLKLEALNA
jgi:glycosyltransferase involved in cell wall biosynthesis